MLFHGEWTEIDHLHHATAGQEGINTEDFFFIDFDFLPKRSDSLAISKCEELKCFKTQTQIA